MLKSVAQKIRRPRHRIGKVEFIGDPFAQTKLDYVRNLLVSSMLRLENKHDVGPLLTQMAGPIPKSLTRPAAKKSKSKLSIVEATENFVRDQLKQLTRLGSKAIQVPSPPEPWLAENLRLAGECVGLNHVESPVLQFMIAATDYELAEISNGVRMDGKHSVTRTLAIATALPLQQVQKALRPRSRLIETGFLQLTDHGDLIDRVYVDARLLELIRFEGLTRDGLMETYLSAAKPPTLGADDFPHLASQIDVARRILTAALAQNTRGVNLFLYGPTGTGKTEVARLLASLCKTKLFVAGAEGDDGESPNLAERLRSLAVGNRMLGTGQSLLLFDEIEDLFEENPFARLLGSERDSSSMSKQWFNLLLESNPAPTIWISNTITGMDPAYLRRFSFVVEVGKVTEAQRRRVWMKHLGSEDILPEVDVEYLAGRFDCSPAQIGTAVSSARLAFGSQLTRATLTAVLDPTEKILNGSRISPMTFDPSRYFSDVLNTGDTNLETIAAQLSTWTPGDQRGVSLCLYGQPGTGKSAYVRYLAHRMDRPLVARRASDLVSKYVGDTEKNIAEAFSEAQRDNAILLLDEADSFLRDRRDATRSWELTQTNEILQQMEFFTGIFACTTNLFKSLDQASLRRFTFKIAFDYLRGDQSHLLFRRTLLALSGEEAVVDSDTLSGSLKRIANLTPGDFSAVSRRFTTLRESPSAQRLFEELVAEVAVKEGSRTKVGY
jgi:transitional endoplasmic reticulum ATPase